MVKRRSVFNIYEYDYEERWINDMASEGLLLTEFKKGFYCFEESDNTHRRYCIIPKKEEEFGPEEMMLYLDMGWKPAFSWNSKTYFYTDDADALALFTDEASYADYLKKNRKAYLRQVVCSIFIVVLWTLVLAQNLPGNQPSLSSLANRDSVSDICYFLVVLFIIGLNLLQGVGFYKCRMRIDGRKKLVWRPEIYTRKKMYKAAESLIIVIILLALVPSMTGGSGKIKGDDILTYNEPYPVLLRTISPDEWAFIRDNRNSISMESDKAVKYDYYLRHSSSLTLKDGFSEEAYYAEAINYSDWELPEYTSLTYDFRSEPMAEKMLRRQVCNDMDIKTDDLGADERIDNIAIAVPDADYAGYYEERRGGCDYQYLYLRKGARIVYASYNGKKELMDSLPLFVNQLK